MAHMPQIPEPLDSELPHVGTPNVAPDFGAAGKGFAQAADTMENAGDELAKQQAKRDAAATKIQDAANDTFARGVSQDYETQLYQQEKDTQQKYLDATPGSPQANPASYPDQVRTQRQELHDSLVKNASPDMAAAIEQQLSSIDERHFHAAHDWMVGRTAQAGNNAIENQTSHALDAIENSQNPAGFVKAQLNGTPGTPGLKSLYKDWRGNPEAAAEQFTHDAAWRWGLAQSAKAPDAFQKNVLDNKNSWFNKTITDPEERTKIANLTKKSDAGFDKTADVQGVKDGIDLTERMTNLALGVGDKESWKPGVADSINSMLERKAEHVKANPELGADSRQAQLNAITLQRDTVNSLDLVWRQNIFATATDDVKTGEELHRQYDKATYPRDGKGSAGKDYMAVLELRHDIAFAAASGKLSQGTFASLSNGLTRAFPRDTVAKAPTPSQARPPRPVEAAGLDLLEQGTGPNGAWNDRSPEQKNTAKSMLHAWATLQQKSGTHITDEMARKEIAAIVNGMHPPSVAGTP